MLDFAPADIVALATANGRMQPLVRGAKLILAQRAGRLQVGWLYPSTYTEQSLQFANGLPAALMAALNAVISSR
ncbi:hypothetical protein EMIT0158MI4_280037 [Burkholderia ambifaria]